MKKLYRSSSNKICCGVIGGIGEYLNVDPVILRLIWILVVVFTGIVPGLIIYLAAVFIVPEKPKVEEASIDEKRTSRK